MVLEEYLAKRHKFKKQNDDKPMEEKTILHRKFLDCISSYNLFCSNSNFIEFSFQLKNLSIIRAKASYIHRTMWV